MTTSAFSEARVRTAQAQASSGELSERHSTRVPVASKPRDLRALDHPTLSEGRRLSVRGAARFGGSQGLCGRNRLLACSKQQVFGPAGSSSELRAPEERSPRMIASRLVLEGADFDRHDTGELLPEPGHPHDREASCLRLVLRDYAGSQEPWIRSPPESSDSVDAYGVRSGRATIRPDHRQRSSPPATHRQRT